jgi:hypothetical protein
LHPSYEPKRPYVGLIVLRGYSQSVTAKAASLNPSSHFQKKYIERWAGEHEIELEHWCSISEEYSRRNQSQRSFNSTGKPWARANFRRWLNQFQARRPDHPVLSKVKLSGIGA